MPLIRHYPGPTALSPLCRESRYGLWCRGCGASLDRTLTVRNAIMGFPCCGWHPTGAEAERLIAALRIMGR